MKKPVRKAAKKAAAKPVMKVAATRPAKRAAAKPVKKVAAKPAKKPSAKVATKPASKKPVTKAAAKPAAKTPKKSSAKSAKPAGDASKRIDQRIRELGDWRGAMLARVRQLILSIDPAIIEEWKWMGTPVWSRDGIICTGETYKSVVKLTFAKGAFLADPSKLFNSSLDGNMRRAIDIRETDALDEAALVELVQSAITLNGAKAAS